MDQFCSLSFFKTKLSDEVEAMVLNLLKMLLKGIIEITKYHNRKCHRLIGFDYLSHG